jgi:hypothetical protein
MQASKSREDLPHFDTFRCLNCGTLIHDSTPRPPAGGDARKPQRSSRGKS